MSRVGLLAILAAACLMAGAWPVMAQTLIPRKVIFGNPERANALVSPDGARIAYLAPVKGVLNIWVGPTADPKTAKPVTQEATRPIRQFLWAANNTHVLYAQDDAGNENFHLHAVDLNTGKILNLTDRKDARAEIVATSYRKPNEILIGLNDRDPKWHDVWRVDVVTGKAQRIEKNDGFASYLADADLNLRIALRATPDGGLQVHKRDGAVWRPFFKIGPDDALTTNPIAISDDGRTLYMLDSAGRDKAALVGRSLATGKVALIGESAKADVADVILDPQTRALLAFSAEYDRPIWTALDPRVADDLAFLGKAIPGVWSLLSQSRDNELWTLRVDNIVEPVSFMTYNRKTKALNTVFVGRPALIGAPLAQMRPHLIKTRDGLTLVAYVTLPKGAGGGDVPDKPLPMVLNVHGGPWARDSLGYDAEHQWMANRGYAVLSVNFRGSTGFGKAFVNAADKQWAAKMHDDLIDAVEWAIAKKIARPDKVAIYGGSYGGYAALVGATFTPKTFACAVSIVGPSNLNTLLASIPPYWESFMDTFRRRVGDPTTPEGRKLLTERSPLFRADKIERPLLIAQGANDPRVKQAESDQIVAAMRKRNIPVTYILYADEGHGFARPENRMSFYAVAEAFLGQCLGGRVQPIGDDFKGASVAAPTGREQIPGLSEALDANTPH